MLGLGAIFRSRLADVLNNLLPSGRRIARRWRIWRGEVPRAKGTHFTVLIADLEGDADGSQTRHVEAALRDHRGLDVLLVGPGPPAFDLGSRTEAQIEDEKRGRALLDEHDGDVLIFGEVAEANTRLRLRFLPHHPGVAGHNGSYQLQAAELPAEFGAHFNAVLLAMVAASVAPVTEQAGTYLVDLLQPAAGKLQQLLTHFPAGLDRDQRANLVHSFALAASVLGEQAGENLWLEHAIAAHREALKERTRERVPLEWAMTQNNLGTALATLGEWESGTARLDEAVAAFREALKEYTRERVPLQWAGTQNNLGNALWRLGERENGTARLEQAVIAFRDALKEYTCERVPLHWAGTQNNLGNALQTLGERESGTARLEQAVIAFREALKERTRERVPLGWAVIQNNLGNALSGLGERESDTARLEEAVAAYREALKERTRERVPLQWATTQNSLGNALRALGERESGTARLEEAVAAYHAALEEGTRERVPLQWAMAKNNLGNALSALGEREKGTAGLEEAVAVYRAALEEWTRENVPLQWAMTQNNLGNALRTLAERESGTPEAGCGHLEEAVAAFGDALNERTRERVPLDWAATLNNLGTALLRLGERESGTARLDAAVAAFREAVKEYTRERVPLDWAMTQNNLGIAFLRLGERGSGTPDAGRGRLEQAVAAYREALEERTRERVPLQWAMTQNNLGNALWTLGERESHTPDAGRGRLEEAVEAYRAALALFRGAGAEHYIAATEANLARAEALLAVRGGASAAE